MPRKPGRESTAMKLPIDKIAMASFFMPWESMWAKRVCIVEGCDHRIDNCVPKGYHATPGIGVDLKQYEADVKNGTMLAKSGPVCAHCVGEITAA